MAALARSPHRATRVLIPLTRPAAHQTAYGLNGHNHQRPGLTIYLPGNGGLLYAVALIAAGWDGAPAPRSRLPRRRAVERALGRPPRSPLAAGYNPPFPGHRMP